MRDEGPTTLLNCSAVARAQRRRRVALDTWIAGYHGTLMKMKKRRLQHRRRMAQIRRRAIRAAQRRVRELRKKRHRVSAATASVEVRVVAPAVLALLPRQYLSDVARFLHHLNAAFISGRGAVCIDFSMLKKVVAGGMLVFYADLCRLMSSHPSVRVRCSASKDETVNQVLEHLKIYERLGYSSGVVPSRNDVVTWKVATSALVDGQKAGELIEAYDSLVGPRSKVVFRGTTEAITNAVYHAYDYSPPRHSVDKRWWMFCREDEGMLVVAVCDRGIGIPNSLPAKFPGEYWRRLVDRFTLGRQHSDGAFIRAAVQMERSRTEQKHRGKGLSDVVRVARECEGATVHIFSNRGLLKFSNNRFIQKEFRHSIEGTVIVWTLPIADRTTPDAE